MPVPIPPSARSFTQLAQYCERSGQGKRGRNVRQVTAPKAMPLLCSSDKRIKVAGSGLYHES
eukprot:417125-Rhodomonas_salina.2